MTKTVALIIAEQNFRDEEYQVPKQILEKSGFVVLTAATTLDKVTGKLGMVAKPDVLLKDLDTRELGALIFVGGGGSSQYFNDHTAHRLAWHFYNLGKVVGAICIAPVILANAGVLRGKRATVFPDGKDRLETNGALYTGELVEVDSKIITGSRVEASESFGNELVKMLNQLPASN